MEGRKCTSLSLIQLHRPSVGVELVTTRSASTAALSTTGWSKYTRIGMPTPTTVPSSGPIEGVVTESGVTVVNEPVVSLASPSAFSATAVTV